MPPRRFWFALSCKALYTAAFDTHFATWWQHGDLLNFTLKSKHNAELCGAFLKKLSDGGAKFGGPSAVKLCYMGRCREPVDLDPVLSSLHKILPNITRFTVSVINPNAHPLNLSGWEMRNFPRFRNLCVLEMAMLPRLDFR
jgi:hypothetical protein